jgi:hypothetical protein
MHGINDIPNMLDILKLLSKISLPTKYKACMIDNEGICQKLDSD